MLDDGPGGALRGRAHPRTVTALQLLEESDDESVFCGPPSDSDGASGAEDRALGALGVARPGDESVFCAPQRVGLRARLRASPGASAGLRARPGGEPPPAAGPLCGASGGGEPAGGADTAALLCDGRPPAALLGDGRSLAGGPRGLSATAPASPEASAGLPGGDAPPAAGPRGGASGGGAAGAAQAGAADWAALLGDARSRAAAGRGGGGRGRGGAAAEPGGGAEPSAEWTAVLGDGRPRCTDSSSTASMAPPRPSAATAAVGAAAPAPGTPGKRSRAEEKRWDAQPREPGTRAAGKAMPEPGAERFCEKAAESSSAPAGNAGAAQQWPGAAARLRTACSDDRRVGDARRLLSKGVPNDAPDRGGKTPLQYAARSGAVACVRALLEDRADPNLGDACNLRPVDEAEYWAVKKPSHDDGSLRTNCLEVLKLLRAHGGERCPISERRDPAVAQRHRLKLEEEARRRRIVPPWAEDGEALAAPAAGAAAAAPAVPRPPRGRLERSDGDVWLRGAPRREVAAADADDPWEPWAVAVAGAAARGVAVADVDDPWEPPAHWGNPEFFVQKDDPWEPPAHWGNPEFFVQKEGWLWCRLCGQWAIGLHVQGKRHRHRMQHSDHYLPN